MDKYIMMIQYSFDTDYVAFPCRTEEEADAVLKEYLEEEIKTIKEECGYVPVVVKEDDLTALVYEEEDRFEPADRGDYDQAVYRVIEIGHGVAKKKKMDKAKYIMMIQYSSDTDYVAVPCRTEEEADAVLKEYLEEEIKTIKEKCGYVPVVVKEDDLTALVYEEEDRFEPADRGNYDQAVYRVIEIGHGVVKKRKGGRDEQG